MTNPSTTWGALAIDGLVAGGIDTVVIAPGSRSTPLVVAATAHPDVTTYSILDERSASFFAVGRAKRSGEPVALVCTSGTAGVNMHPAVVEADRSRTPLVVCTADRPDELHAAGANQTIDQRDLFGHAVRAAPQVPAARGDETSVRALHTTMTTAVHRSTHPYPGPVHLNVPFRKPLSPAEPAPDEVPDLHPTLSADPGTVTPSPGAVRSVADRLGEAAHPLIVAGPTTRASGEDIRTLAETFGIPIAADPLSGIRFGSTDVPVLGAYDAVFGADVVDPPDLVLRFGARPTSVELREALASADADDVLIDPFGAYRDPTFAAECVVCGTAGRVVRALTSEVIDCRPDAEWIDRLMAAEGAYWSLVSDDPSALPEEGRIAYRTVVDAPSDTTLFISNSMPIRDVDRFGPPIDRSVDVVGNRGASGIDGITSTAIGAASAADGPAVLLTGDLAFYHDMNGLLAMDRCGVDLTIVIVNNDGGGIFHKLPIAEVDPPFTEQFLTPHGLDFSHVADLYDIPYRAVAPDDFGDTYRELSGGPAIVDVEVDGNRNHRDREAFQTASAERLRDRLGPV